jgi:hypothetical protein
VRSWKNFEKNVDSDLAHHIIKEFNRWADKAHNHFAKGECYGQKNHYNLVFRCRYSGPGIHATVVGSTGKGFSNATNYLYDMF